MSKAEEEKLLEKARKYSLEYTTSLERSGKALSGFDLDMAYLKGYHQAEKDLALTWEDVKEIFNLFSKVAIDLADSLHTNDDVYKGILKCFKEQKYGK